MKEDRRRKVSHPILRLEVLRADGTRQSTHRVFCKRQLDVVPIGICCGCVHCESIDAAPVPSVNCVVETTAIDPRADPLGLRTPVGAVLVISPAAVTADTTVSAAFAALREHDRRALPVVDDDGSLLGIVDEMHCREILGHTAEAVMSSKLALGALTPVRRALELMAAAHLREITVVDDTGRPLGILRDIDALGWLAHAKRQA